MTLYSNDLGSILLNKCLAFCTKWYKYRLCKCYEKKIDYQGKIGREREREREREGGGSIRIYFLCREML